MQMKIKKNKELYQIVDEVEENVITIQPIYEAIKEHPKTDKEERDRNRISLSFYEI